MNKIVSFTQNWNNKLNCKVFTTFRRTGTGYYKIGDKYDVLLNDKKRSLHLGTTELIDGIKYKLNDVPQSLTYLDTGYNRADFIILVKTMYKNKIDNIDSEEFVFLFFKYV